MSQYWTPLVNKLQPYIPGEQPQDQHYIKLNTNENPYPPSPKVISAIEDYNKSNLRLYPDPESNTFRETLSSVYNINKENIFVGNGSDEVLAHSFQAFFKKSQPLLFPQFSYSFYPVYCGLYEISYELVPHNDDFSIDISRYNKDNGGIIIPNPNAPTGILLSLNNIECLCQQSLNSVVIIDEAYIDFGGESAIELTKKFDNLLVIQTFSKSRSLAGLRLGFAIGHKDLIEGLNRVKDSFNSYPIDSLAQTAASASLLDNDYYLQHCQKIINTRNQMTDQLTELNFEVLPSATNFVFARHRSESAAKLYQLLKEQGVLVRFFKKPGIDNFLRISVGTDSETIILLEKLTQIL